MGHLTFLDGLLLGILIGLTIENLVARLRGTPTVRRFNDALDDAIAWSIETGAIIGVFIAVLVLGITGVVYLLTH
jgi:hypothetical protein